MLRRIALAISLCPVAAPHAAAAEAPATAHVTAASAAGSGCPATQKIEAKLSSDLSSLTIDLPALKAELDPSKGKRLVRANCDVVVTIEHAPGFQLAPAGHAVKLFGNIESGVEAKLAYRYHFQGQKETKETELDYSKPGPIAPKSVELDAGTEWSPCGQSSTLVQSVSTRLMDKGAKAPSALELGAGAETTLKWRACK